MSKYVLVEGYAKIAGISLDDLSKHLGITKRTLYNKISGKTDFTLEEAKKIKTLLGRSIDEIFLH